MFSISINYNRSLMSLKQLAEVVCLKESALAMLLSVLLTQTYSVCSECPLKTTLKMPRLLNCKEHSKWCPDF